MDVKSRFADKLNEILFLEVKKEKIKRIFNTEILEDIYLPVKSSNIVDNVKSQKDMDQIPLSFFIEGMVYVLGADENFRFNNEYKTMLLNIKDAILFTKSKIALNVKEKKYEDAYILLKGLLNIDDSVEVYDKIIIMAEELRNKDKSYKEEELEIIEKAKVKEGYPLPYFYEAIIRREEGDFQKALFCINNYIAKGGEQTVEVTELKESLKLVIDYEMGKEILFEQPKEALKLLLPLLQDFGNDATLYYYIAVAYRILENFEKAIYYLNEALSIDSNIVEVVNELGINYASLGNFENAIAYLRKAFEVTKSVEICTNLIMCYLNSGDVESARKHLDIAKKLDPKDEIVVQLEGMMG
ncbi:tetratricopeptide repeat protein [Clostridium sp. CX1]|uniref:Tetratricopeptide repeat protein n=1 Tax=Clostridium tanneri TaxID=3037988 RepID=A0ABU4JT37_9CLOT|nr:MULTISPECIES: tetratricopeptide repeat protein [unclassified Clostridium]MCT8977264.1 tetratricopeptide repeat protein [Clostridium sp. CX1]MDW8801322.1 tetratricopeptide repeat protein [Clostridium sp. A1-XYC3]